LIELTAEPGDGSKLKRVVPLGGCARRFVIDQKIFIIAADDRPILLDHDFSRLPGKGAKVYYIPGHNDLIHIEYLHVL
jgi:hypothetical protein